MSKQNSERPYRITLDFNRDSEAYITDLQGDTSCRTKADLLRQSLTILRFLVDELAAGNKLIIENSKKQQREVVLPIMITKKPSTNET